VLLSGPAKADILFLKNGDKISGKLTQHGRGGVHFIPQFGGEVAVPWAMIQSIQKGGQTNASQTISPPESGPTEPTPPVPQAATPVRPAKQIMPEKSVTKSPDAEKTKKLKGMINLGATLNNGNTDTRDFHIDGSMTWKDNKNRIKADVSADQEKDGDATTEAKAEFDLSYDRFFTPKWFWETNLGFEHDDEEDLDLRSQFGTGPGYQFFEGDALNLAGTAGVNYVHDDFGDNGTDESFSGRWTIDYDQKIYRDKLKAFHEHEGLVSVEDSEDFLFQSKTGLRVLLSKHLTGTTQVEFDYDNLPSANAGKSDTSYKILLGYEW